MSQSASASVSRDPQPQLRTPDQPPRATPAVVVFLLILAAWTLVVGWVRVTHPGLDHGDITTDSNILNAGENFDREGFWSSWGVPSLDTFREEGKKPDHYVTYPPGCYWLHQALKQTGLRELWHFRVAAVAWSSLAALLFFMLCFRASGAALPAAIAATAFVLSRPFTEYADNLHYLAFSQVTLFATLLGWVLVEQAQTPRARLRWLVFAAAMFTLDSLVTFEHTLFILMFGMVRLLYARRWGLLVSLAVLGAVPVAVLVARMAVNAAALGSFADVWSTMDAKLRQRTGATGGASWPELARQLLDRLGWRGSVSPAGSPNSEVRIGAMAPAFLAPLAMLSVIALSTWHLEGMKCARRAMGLAAALLIGGATWSLVMREHAVVHRFTNLLLLPGVAAMIGALVTFGWWQRRLQPRGAPVRVAGCVAGCVLIVAHVTQMRHSHLLNIPWRLDPVVHERNRIIDEFESRFAAARPAFAGVKRLYMFSHDAQLGRKLGVRFDNDVGKVHAPLAAGEVQMIDWRGAARAMLDSTTGNGPPRVLAEPAGHLAFFFAGRREIGAAAITLADRTRVSRLWLEPTLDGSAVVVGAAVEANPGTGAAGLALHVRVRDKAGKVLFRQTVFAEQCVSVTDQAVLWVQFGLPRGAEGRAVEAWFTREGQGRLAVDPQSTLPAGITLDADGRTMRIGGDPGNPAAP